MGSLKSVYDCDPHRLAELTRSCKRHRLEQTRPHAKRRRHRQRSSTCSSIRMRGALRAPEQGAFHDQRARPEPWRGPVARMHSAPSSAHSPRASLRLQDLILPGWTTTAGPAAALGCAPRSNARRDSRSRRTEWLGLAPSRPREIGPGSSGDAWCSEGQCRIGGVRPAPLAPSRPTCERCRRCTKPACRVRAGRRRLERTTGAGPRFLSARGRRPRWPRTACTRSSGCWSQYSQRYRLSGVLRDRL